MSIEARRLSLLTSCASATEANGKTIVLVPTGATEQHGPHLPLGTDVLIADALARDVADNTDGVMVADPISYGCSWHHTGFPGTVTLRTRTFIALVCDVCRSLSVSGFVPVVLNGHFGNKAPLQVALTDLAEVGVRTYAFSYFDLLAEALDDILPEPTTSAGHACALETSLMMHLRPRFVENEVIPSGGTPAAWPDPHMFGKAQVSVVRPFEEINRTGVIGTPGEATAERGERIFELAAMRCGEVVSKILREAA